MYTREEFKILSDDALAENADVVGVLLRLCDAYGEAMTAVETKTVSPEQYEAVRILTDENAMLRKTNTELYLRIGTADAELDAETDPEPETDKKITYEDIGV